MQPVKVIELINKLTDSDISRLTQLLKSSEKIKTNSLKLFNEIARTRPFPQNQTEQLWKSLYGKQPLNANRFRKLCFDLLQQIEAVLGLLHVEQHQIGSGLHRMHYHADRNNENMFEQQWGKLKKRHLGSPALSAQHYHDDYIIELARYDFLAANSSKSKSNNILQTSDALDRYYLLQKLKLLCHAVNEEQFTNYNGRPAYDHFILQAIEAIADKDPLLRAYLSIYKLFTTEDARDEFGVLKKSMEQTTHFAEHEWKVIYQYVINYCIIQLNAGKEFEHELFGIYKSSLQNIHDKIFSPFRYKNIINLALKLKQYEFAGTFIDAYGKLLPEDQRETSIAFNRAKLNYELKKYDAVIQTLQQVKTDDLTFNLSAKVLLTKTFYEKKEFQFLDSFLESFRIYVLRNKKMNTASKKLYQAFIKNIHRLVSLEYKPPKDIRAFSDKINQTEHLTDKAWLLEKITQL